MKIREIAIDGFGVWSELRLEDLNDRITVFYGPNEAGKSTLMQFVRSMLYGFSADRRKRYLPPVHGGRPGGALRVAAVDGNYLVRRHSDDEDLPEQLEIISGDQRLRDNHLLSRILGNVDEAIYRNVFAIGLREIQELGALGDTEAAKWLYKLAAGGDRVSLVDVLAELTKARERLLSAGEGPSTIPQLIAERDRLRRESADQTSVRQYIDLGRKQRDLAEQMEDWERAATAAERQARLVEVASGIYDKWHARIALENDLAVARRNPPVEQPTIEELEALEGAIARVKRQRKSLARRNARNKRELADLALDTAVSRHATRIQAILEQEQWITALDAERVALMEKVSGLEKRRGELCAQLGFDPAETAQSTGQSHGKAWRQLKLLAGELRSARLRLNEANEEAAQRQQGSHAAAQQLASALKARGAESVTPLLENSGQLVSQLRRRVQIDERLEDLAQSKQELELRSRDLLAHLLLPGWALVGLGVVFVGGVVSLLAGMFLPASLVGASSLPFVVMGLGASGGAAVTKFILEQSIAQRSDTCLAQLDSLATQIDKANSERHELDSILPRGGGPLLARLQAAEKEQALVEALLPLESQRKAGAQHAEEAAARRDQAQREYAELRHRWRHALIDAGLSPKTAPGRAGRMARLRKQLTHLDARLGAERAELARRQSVVDAFTNRLAQLRADLDLLPEEAADDEERTHPRPSAATARLDTEALAAELRALREKLHEQAALVSRRKSLARLSRRLAVRRKKIRRHALRLDRKLQALFDRDGVADAAELRHRAQESVRAQQLSLQLEAAAAEIAVLLGPQTDEEEVAAIFQSHSRHDLDRDWLDLSTQARDLREKVKTGHEQLGRWKQETETLLAGRKASQARIRCGAVDRQLREATTRWQVLATTAWFLTGIRKRYERERQPETLREASGYLEQLTEGRYLRVWTPIDEDVLRVEDADGRSLPVEVLSRGTREQLFLSLRLALVRWYARRGIELPLVLDDVLVNFDARRTAAAAKVLRDFAERGHQVLVFTCHEHIGRLFASLEVEVRELPANPRAAAFRHLVAELPMPLLPVVVPEPPPAPRQPPIEVVAIPTNGHVEEPVEAVEVPPPPPPPPPIPTRKRAHVKFDTVHGPRGPFSTALWHERVTYELSAEEDDSPEPAEELDDWTDLDTIE